MTTQKILALVKVEFKKLFRDPMTLAILVLMPVALTVIFYFTMGDLYQDVDKPDMSHFEYLVPGTMGYAIIYMAMMIALALCEYRDAGLLKRIGTTPTSPTVYLGSILVANVIFAVVQGLIVLVVSMIFGYEVSTNVIGWLVMCAFLAALAVTAVGLGLITATVAKSVGAASGLSVIYILPMMMFGTFLAVFDDTTRAIAHLTPNFYATDSLTMIFEGTSLSDPIIWRNLLILVAISAGIIITGIQLFKRTEFR